MSHYSDQYEFDAKQKAQENKKERSKKAPTIIFLDIDGVLNTPSYGTKAYAMYKKTKGWFKSRDQYGALFDPMAVECLEYLAHTTNAKIVVSSSWRKSGLEVMKEMFKYRAIDIEIIDTTPILNTIRGNEIEQWLLDNDYVTNYVILDDDTDFTQEQLQKHFVHTHGPNGFDHNCMVKALKILMERV
jgi:hypothetical protein